MPDPEAAGIPSRRWLAIDGALGTFSAAVLAGDAAFTEAISAKRTLEQGLLVVERVLNSAGLRLANIDALAVGIGPGSFTGLRIAVSYAKGLAFALRRPLVGISSYDIVEFPAPPPPVVAVVAGRSGVACLRLRASDGVWTRCGSYETLVELVAEHVGTGPIAVCGAVEGVAAELGERGFTVRALPFPNSPALAAARLAAERLAQTGAPSSAPHDVRPDYGELPAAEVRNPAPQ